MSRSGYSDDIEQWSLIRWRGAVASSLRGRRGQAFLREALAALDALPTPELIENDLVAEGAFCTLGAVGRARASDLRAIDPHDQDGVAAAFAIPRALACEIMSENDDGSYRSETPRARWERMRTWIVANMRGDQPAGSAEGVAPVIEGDKSREEHPSPASMPQTGGEA